MKKRQGSSWSDLPVELLESIVIKLSIVDVARFKQVCSSWYNVATRGYPRGPFITIPDYPTVQILSLRMHEDEVKIVHTAKNNLEKFFGGGRCVGSSHGWLVILDRLGNPSLLNLFTGKDIELPRVENFPDINNVEELEDDEYVLVKFRPEHEELPVCCHRLLVKEFQRILIEKAIISTNPICDKNYKVIIIYGLQSKLALCNHRDYEWTVLCNSSEYQDMVWHNNMLYALAKKGKCIEVEGWDFNDTVPKRKVIFSPSYQEKVDVRIRFDAIKFYLALSMGDILVIQRYIEDPEIRTNQELQHPYRTRMFKVFKLDLIQQKLSDLKSLKGQTLFVGGNQTISLCAKDFKDVHENFIYFTDDYWDGIDRDYKYGGHDIGVFHVEGDRVALCFGGDVERNEPISFWLSTV